jgi:hypothetical protein
VTAAQITVQPSPLSNDIHSDQLPPIYAGQPISATLILKTSFHWAEKEGKQHSYKMRYDVEERVKDWLLCGRKRGDFVATVGSTTRVHTHGKPDRLLEWWFIHCSPDLDSPSPRRNYLAQGRRSAIANINTRLNGIYGAKR